jgi:hypothetical protein
MSVERLLLENQFSIADDVDLGTFDDIVSAHADNRTFFRIGMIRRDVARTGKILPLGMLITYEKYDGLPRDVSFTCTYGHRELALRRIGKEFHYRTRENAVDQDTDMKRLIAQWIEDHKKPSGNFKKLDYQFGPEQSLLFPLSLIAHNVTDAKRFPMPILSPMVFPPLTWVAPIRTKPRRTYDELRRVFSSEGTHTPYLIRKILDTESQAKRFKRIIHMIGKDSGLFDRVEINRYGPENTSPFEIRIVLDDKPFNLTNVGYGVSQALPVVVEMLWREVGSWFAIQQPEVHLHPRAQAALGDLIFVMSTSRKQKFLIETHSDFMIDRYRTRLRGVRNNGPDSQLLFFERKNRFNTVTPLEIGLNGELPLKQPQGYRRFFIREQMDLLGL